MSSAGVHPPGDDYFHHVRDANVFELPFGNELHLPSIAGFQITKFMVLQVIAGLLTLLIFRGLVKRVNSGKATKGIFWNFWESIALFIRDEVVRPTIGDPHHHDHGDHGDEHGDDHGHGGAHPPAIAPSGAVLIDASHPADKYLPFIWTCFFYVLFCNLLGAIPMLGSATASISVTLSLALFAFGATILYSVQAIGWKGFVKNFLGGVEVNSPMDYAIAGILFPVEVMGFLVKHGVLAIRLFANIMGGHAVLGLILTFIAMAANAGFIYWVVAPASVLGQVGVGLLELLVAFIQAYVFSFLATIFVASGLHEH